MHRKANQKTEKASPSKMTSGVLYVIALDIHARFCNESNPEFMSRNTYFTYIKDKEVKRGGQIQ